MSHMTMGDEIHALRCDRASILKENDRLEREYGDLEKERDALAAYVERLREGLHQALVLWGPHCLDEEGAAYAECEKRCDESPANSLACLIAEKQAEALESLAARYALDDSACVVEVTGEARCRAAKLRRHAKGGSKPCD